ncbi:MAG: DUF4230 domain-containing protein [Coriobacteriia bacterium]|nr:DUF4230 domain-containing protein [Coriobacteriia bacterium]
MAEEVDKPSKLKKPRRRMSPKFVLIVVIIVVVAVCTTIVAVSLTGLLGKSGITEVRERGNAIEAEEVIKSFKISTVTYRYTNFIYEKDVKTLGGVELPFTDAYLGVQYDGVIEIGIDGSEIKVTQTEDTITIRLPEAKILSHTQVSGSTEVLIDKGTVFNRNEVGEYIELFESRKLAMEERVEEMGLFEEARENAKEQLLNLLYAFPDVRDTYTIIFE